MDLPDVLVPGYWNGHILGKYSPGMLVPGDGMPNYWVKTYQVMVGPTVG